VPSRVLGEPFYQRSLTTDSRHACETSALALARAEAADVEADVEVLEAIPQSASSSSRACGTST